MKILFYGFCHAHVDAMYRRAMQMSDQLEIAGCIEEDKRIGEAAADRLGFSLDSECYENWLEKDIDIVAIGGKYGQRGEAAIKALQHGKHVISDKPLCTRIEELKEIEKIVKEKQVKIGCILELRYERTVCRARELLRQNRLGEIRNISFTGQHCLNYEHRPSWYFEEGMYGGTIIDLGIHGIDVIRDITGLEIVKADGVRTWNAYAVKQPEFRDCAVFMARLSNGAELMGDVSFSAPPQVFSMPTYWNFKIWCERGLMTFHLSDKAVIVYEDGVSEPQVFEGVTAKKDYFTEFLEEIREDTNTLTQSVIDSTRTVLQIQKVADENR